MLALIILFGKLSLLAIGGVTSTLSEISREVVQQRHWLTPEQFSQFYAISNAAPGPNVMIATVIGEHEAGFVGGIVATLAMILPSGILVVFVARYWDRYREARLRKIIQAGLLPITAGLLLSAASVLVVQSDTRLVAACVTALCGLLSWRTKLHPVWLLAGGLAVGLAVL
jgi:chromate transporter